MSLLKGVLVATITPFQKNGEIDEAAARRHLEYLKSKGVHGFVPCGTTGEAPTLELDERNRLIRLAIEVADELPVVPGCGGNSTKAAIEAVNRAADLGCSAALVVTPYYNKPTLEGCYRHFMEIADRGRLPLVLYNVPSRTAVNLSPDLVLRLWKHEKIVGIKEASPHYSQWLTLASRADLTKKSLLAGDDEGFAPILSLGGSGIISAAANVAPSHFVSLYDAFLSKNDESFRKQKQLFPLVRALFLETNPGPIKYALSKLGRCENSLRLPLVAVDDKTAMEIDEALKTLEIFS